MATNQEIFENYCAFIEQKVVNEYGGSYQTVETQGKTWCKDMMCTPEREQFIIGQTRLFLHMQQSNDIVNLNLMYAVCEKISNYLAEYIAKKSEDLTTEQTKKDIMHQIYFSFKPFVNGFKHLIPESKLQDEHWCACNKGVVAMNAYLKAHPEMQQQIQREQTREERPVLCLRSPAAAARYRTR